MTPAGRMGIGYRLGGNAIPAFKASQQSGNNSPQQALDVPLPDGTSDMLAVSTTGPTPVGAYYREGPGGAVADGDLVFVFAYTNNGSGGSSSFSISGSGWTLLERAPDINGQTFTDLYYKIHQPGDPTSVTVTSVNAGPVVALSMAFSGVQTPTIDVSASASYSAPSFAFIGANQAVAPSVTASRPGLLINFWGERGGSNLPAAGSFAGTRRAFQSSNQGGLTVAAATQEVPVGVTNGKLITWTTSNAVQTAGCSVVI